MDLWAGQRETRRSQGTGWLTDAPPSTPAAPQVENTLSGFTSAKVGTFWNMHPSQCETKLDRASNWESPIVERVLTDRNGVWPNNQSPSSFPAPPVSPPSSKLACFDQAGDWAELVIEEARKGDTPVRTPVSANDPLPRISKYHRNTTDHRLTPTPPPPAFFGGKTDLLSALKWIPSTLMLSWSLSQQP